MTEAVEPPLADATNLNPLDLIERLRAKTPEALQGVDDRTAARVLRAALAELRDAVDATEAGTLAVPSLGRFHVRQVAPEGQAAGAAQPGLRRVIFLTARAAADAAAAKALRLEAQAQAADSAAVPVDEAAADLADGIAVAATAPDDAVAAPATGGVAPAAAAPVNKGAKAAKRKKRLR
jgi:hypothetical protein